MHYPKLTLTVGGANLASRQVFINTGARLLCTSDGGCVIVHVGAGMVWGGGVLFFILGSNLGGVGPDRGLCGGERKGWCEEKARSS
jgi:hypothetical protein